MGFIMSAMGAQEQGQAEANSDNFRAQMAYINAQIERENAAFAGRAGDIQATNAGLQARQTLGDWRAGEGARGVDVNSGSLAQTYAGADEAAVANAETIRSNAAIKAWGFETQATQDVNEAHLEIMAGENAKIAASNAALGDILGGATSLLTSGLKLGGLF